MANQQHLEILHSGPEKWNEWRIQNPELKPDLSGMQLKDFSLEGINFKSVDLSRSRLEQVNLKGVVLEYANVSDSRWREVNCAGSDCSDADFSGCRLENCNFSQSDLQHTNFVRASLVSCKFDEAILTEVDFDRATLEHIDFMKVSLDKPRFNKSILIKPIFEDFQFDKSLFENTRVDEPDIRGKSSFLMEEERGSIDMDDYVSTKGEVQFQDEYKPEPQPEPAMLPGDTVSCSIYAPPEAALGQTIMIQSWLHLWEEKKEVKELAVVIDDSAVLRQFSTLGLPVQHKERLHLVLESKHGGMATQTQVTRWLGTAQSIQFLVDIPPDMVEERLFFTLRVFLEQTESRLPCGEISFFIKIKDQAEAPLAAVPVGNRSRRYNYAFVSYSSKDRAEVLSRVQMLRVFDQQFFMDVLSLQPGEEWNPELEKKINECDLFLLFWSGNARDSEWVIKEVRLALARKKGISEALPYIQPIPLELPLVPPPPELGHLHFNDSILYFIEKEVQR